ncbi:MAG: type II toxin-antitoxin system VapC family toxin [Parachlamydiaceae bacterium]
MSYLLDTCALSELRKDVSNPVRNWFEGRSQDLFYLSVVTIAELCDGIERLPKSKKKKDLEDWFYGEIHSRFKDRILPIGDLVAKEWGCLNASLRKKGISVAVQDLYIAATAKSHGFALVTLNVKDFEWMNTPVVNPWA